MSESGIGSAPSQTRCRPWRPALFVLAVLSAGVLAGPPEPATFVVRDGDLHHPLNLIAYGDMRFTDPANVTATNPQARQALVDRIAAEHPDALFLNGDIPYIGGDPKDYAEFHREATPWRQAGLRVFPALGNHEFKSCEEAACLENWWTEFPSLRGRRWYSVQLGVGFFAIGLDSDAPLLPGSEQMQWLQARAARAALDCPLPADLDAPPTGRRSPAGRQGQSAGQ